MTFSLFLNDQAEILRELLELYLPGGGKIIDLTFGKGALWTRIFSDSVLRSKYPVTACDASPDAKASATVSRESRT